MLLDGGAGQLDEAMQIMADLGVDDIALVGVAKGPDRDAGLERFFLPGKPPFMLEPKSPVLYFLQRLRDEAHRFAIGTHRAQRAIDMKKNPLDEIEGVGPARKKALLHAFGSARGREPGERGRPDEGGGGQCSPGRTHPCLFPQGLSASDPTLSESACRGRLGAPRSAGLGGAGWFRLRGLAAPAPSKARVQIAVAAGPTGP